MTPLAGQRVLDLGALCEQRPHALAVSMAAKLCVAYGAVVIRPIPPDGEPFAGLSPLLPAGGSALDRFVNAGKHRLGISGQFDVAIGDSAALDAHAGGCPLQACVSVFGPGENPPITELALMALSGLLVPSSPADRPPNRLPGHQLAYAAGLAACTGLLAAVRAGAMETIDVSLFGVAVWLNWKRVAGTSFGVRSGGGVGDWTVVPVRDGYVALVYQDKDWPALAALVGDERLLDARFETRAGRRQNQVALLALLAPWLVTRSRAEVTAAAQAWRIPIGAVLWPAELLDDAQYAARSFLAADGTPLCPALYDGHRVGDRGRHHGD